MFPGLFNDTLSHSMNGWMTENVLKNMKRISETGSRSANHYTTMNQSAEMDIKNYLCIPFVFIVYQNFIFQQLLYKHKFTVINWLAGRSV